MPGSNPINRRFLFVDDDPDDADMFCEALSKIGPTMECLTVQNGVGLFEFLAKDGAPDVIFLDINMPMMNGWECLKRLKMMDTFKNIPTIMYSTSSASRDVKLAYDLGAEVFLTKPENFKELAGILQVVATNSKESIPSQLSGFKSFKVN
jgi:CheY-like chemotaxis protein